MLATKKKIVCVAGSNLNTNEHKVNVLGDSHPKDTGARIDQFLTSKFEVSIWIKPSASTHELVATMENDFKDLEKSDVIVIKGWGGLMMGLHKALRYISALIGRRE